MMKEVCPSFLLFQGTLGVHPKPDGFLETNNSEAGRNVTSARAGVTRRASASVHVALSCRTLSQPATAPDSSLLCQKPETQVFIPDPETFTGNP